jgi:hypothetical protein
MASRLTNKVCRLAEFASPELALSLPMDANGSHVGVRTPQNMFDALLMPLETWKTLTIFQVSA